MRTNHKEYLSLIERIRTGLFYFQNNTKFKDSNHRERQLREALKLGIQHVEFYFKKQLLPQHPYDLHRLMSPDLHYQHQYMEPSRSGFSMLRFSENREHSALSAMSGGTDEMDSVNDVTETVETVIEPDVLDLYGDVATCLMSNGKLSFLRQNLLEGREKQLTQFFEYALNDAVKRTASLLEPSNISHLLSARSSAENSGFNTPNRSRSATIQTSLSQHSSRYPTHANRSIRGGQAAPPRRYKKGKHPSLFYMRLLYFVVQTEQKLFMSTLHTNAAVPKAVALQDFAKAIEPSLEKTLKRVLRSLREEGKDSAYKLFSGLDFLNVFQTLLPQFSKVLEPENVNSSGILDPGLRSPFENALSTATSMDLHSPSRSRTGTELGEAIRSPIRLQVPDPGTPTTVLDVTLCFLLAKHDESIANFSGENEAQISKRIREPNKPKEKIKFVQATGMRMHRLGTHGARSIYQKAPKTKETSHQERDNRNCARSNN